jgi:hypothetical protein
MDSASPSTPEAPVSDLQRIFGARLEAVVAYGGVPPAARRSLALVSSLTMDDLSAMALAVPSWHARGLATPLVLPRAEFARTLDAFPVEYGEIIETHHVLVGTDPFEGVRITPHDLRRGLEAQAASHLLHLRENYMEHGGRHAAIEALVRESAPGFHAILRRMARMDGAPADTPVDVARWATARAALDARTVGDVLALATEASPGVDATRLFPAYLDALETLLHVIDQWPAS